MLSAYIGELMQQGADDPENLFKINSVVSGDSIAPPVSATGCTMQMPA